MSKAKRGLGRGLGALIPQEEVKSNEVTGSVEEIDLDTIKPNRDQPRKNFDRESIQVLADSIREYGVIQPIVLKKIKNGFELIAGERRWRAAKTAGLKTIPAVIKDFDAETTAKVALIENLQREDLSPIEEARAYTDLIDQYSLTQEQVAKSVGKSRTYVTNTLRLLKLDIQILELIDEMKISSGHGRALLMIEDQDMRWKIAEMIVSKQLSVREVEKIAADAKKISVQPISRKPERDAEMMMFESRLKGFFGTKVNIKAGKKKGKIEIEYYNEDDLNRILSLIELD